MGPEETRVLTFSELKELIETGRTDQIPNNKAIPNVLNVGSPLVSLLHGLLTVLKDTPPSEAILLARKKPWELGRGIDK
jgi:hypothetical protein